MWVAMPSPAATPLEWRIAGGTAGGAGKVEHVVFAIVLAQMVLGLVMAQIHIYSWVQVLHVGLAAVLLSFVWLWLFGLTRPQTASP